MDAAIAEQIIEQLVEPVAHNHDHPSAAVQLNNGAYGIITPEGISRILQYKAVSDVLSKNNSIFIDIGSGIGNVVFQAALQVNPDTCTDVVGIELIAERAADAEFLETTFYGIVKEALALYARRKDITTKTSLHLPNITLLHGSFLGSGPLLRFIEQRRPSVVYCNNARFEPDLDLQLQDFLSQHLPPGSVLVVSKELPRFIEPSTYTGFLAGVVNRASAIIAHSLRSRIKPPPHITVPCSWKAQDSKIYFYTINKPLPPSSSPSSPAPLPPQGFSTSVPKLEALVLVLAIYNEHVLQPTVLQAEQLQAAEKGLDVHWSSDDRGYGVFANRQLDKSTNLGAYPGELVDANEGNRRESASSSGYRFFFRDRRAKPPADMCFDATHVTPETAHFTRRINHASPGTVACNVIPRLEYTPAPNHRKVQIVFRTTRTIQPREELCFSYNDPDQIGLANAPEAEREELRLEASRTMTRRQLHQLMLDRRASSLSAQPHP